MKCLTLIKCYYQDLFSWINTCLKIYIKNLSLAIRLKSITQTFLYLLILYILHHVEKLYKTICKSRMANGPLMKPHLNSLDPELHRIARTHKCHHDPWIVLWRATKILKNISYFKKSSDISPLWVQTDLIWLWKEGIFKSPITTKSSDSDSEQPESEQWWLYWAMRFGVDPVQLFLWTYRKRERGRAREKERERNKSSGFNFFFPLIK